MNDTRSFDREVKVAIQIKKRRFLKKETNNKFPEKIVNGGCVQKCRDVLYLKFIFENYAKKNCNSNKIEKDKYNQDQNHECRQKISSKGKRTEPFEKQKP